MADYGYGTHETDAEAEFYSETTPEDAQRMCRHIMVKAVQRDMVRCMDCGKLIATVVWAVDRARLAT